MYDVRLPDDVIVVLCDLELQLPELAGRRGRADGLAELLPPDGRHLLRPVHRHLRELDDQRREFDLKK